jgi:hypothetical protein
MHVLHCYKAAVVAMRALHCYKPAVVAMRALHLYLIPLLDYVRLRTSRPVLFVGVPANAWCGKSLWIELPSRYHTRGRWNS